MYVFYQCFFQAMRFKICITSSIVCGKEMKNIKRTKNKINMSEAFKLEIQQNCLKKNIKDKIIKNQNNKASVFYGTGREKK